MQKLSFEGTITSGEGNGKKFLALPWVKQQIKNHLGFAPYLGTLNLQLTENSIQNKKHLKEEAAKKILPAQGYCAGWLFSASIKGIACAVVVPQVKKYPEKLLEIIAPVNLREKLKIKDGDVVNVSVFV